MRIQTLRVGETSEDKKKTDEIQINVFTINSVSKRIFDSVSGLGNSEKSLVSIDRIVSSRTLFYVISSCRKSTANMLSFLATFSATPQGSPKSRSTFFSSSFEF